MFNKLELDGEIARSGFTKQRFCKEINMAQSTYIRKAKNGTFDLNEADKICRVLKIKALKRRSEIFLSDN